MPDAQARDIVEPTEEMVELGAKACRHVTFNALTMDECRDAVRAALTAALTRDPHQPRRMKPMDGKHTPGPWHSKKHGSRHRIVDRQDITLAHVPIGYMDYAAGNARLIAAAPEMFEALEHLTELFVDLRPLGDDTDKEMAIINARAALSKATGDRDEP